MTKRPFLLDLGLLLSLFVGLVQGLAGSLGLALWPKNSPLAAAAILAAMTAIAVIGLSVQLTAGERFNRQQFVLTLLLAGLVAAVSAWLMWQVPGGSQSSNRGTSVLMTSWTICSVLLVYILIPFVQAWPTRRHGRYRYADLYQHSWDNFFILLVAALLTLAYWLLIVLWVMLFKMVGIALFEIVFFNGVFPWLSLAVVFSLGIRLTRKHDQVIGALRHIALSLCFFLMPLSAVITVLLGLSLPFTGLQPIWDTGYSTPVLLCLLGTNLLFINGIFQDGAARPLHGGLARLFELALVLLPVYALIGAYSVYLRIDQYGLTPNRFLLMVLVVVATCYSLVYSLAVFRRSSSWLGLIRPGNQIIALAICILILLVHSPLLNPVAWSARNQYHRLLTGKVSAANFDFGALKFRLGQPGLNYLQQLNTLPADHPLKDAFRTWLIAVNEAQTYYQWQKQKQSDGSAAFPQVETVDGKATVPKDFSQILDDGQCRTETCYVLPVDLDRDDVEELIFFDMRDQWLAPELYDRDAEGHWVRQGTVGHSMKREQRQALIDRIRQGTYQVVGPQYDDLEVDEEVYSFFR